jgi:hypothetical protein
MRQRWKLVVPVVLAAMAMVLFSYIALRPRPDGPDRGRILRGCKDSADGERAAREDLSNGHYALVGYGRPAPWVSEFDQCLQGYGIEVRNIGGDVFTSDALGNLCDAQTGYGKSYYEAYNAASSAAMKQKFGSHVLDRCLATARKKWESSHPESQRE